MGLTCRNRREVFVGMLLRVYITKIVSLSGQILSDVLFHCFMILGGSHSAFSTNHIMDLVLRVDSLLVRRLRWSDGNWRTYKG